MISSINAKKIIVLTSYTLLFFEKKLYECSARHFVICPYIRVTAKIHTCSDPGVQLSVDNVLYYKTSGQIWVKLINFSGIHTAIL